MTKSNWGNCKKCGAQYGLHPNSLGHLFVGEPFANPEKEPGINQRMNDYLDMYGRTIPPGEYDDINPNLLTKDK